MWRNTGRRCGSETSFVCAATRFCRRMFCCSAAATRTACVTLRRPHWTVKPTSSRGRWCAALSTWWVFRTVVCLLWNPISWVKNWNRSILVLRTIKVMLCLFRWSVLAYWESHFTPLTKVKYSFPSPLLTLYVLRPKMSIRELIWAKFDTRNWMLKSSLPKK